MNNWGLTHLYMLTCGVRVVFFRTREGWNFKSYAFCEHWIGKCLQTRSAKQAHSKPPRGYCTFSCSTIYFTPANHKLSSCAAFGPFPPRPTSTNFRARMRHFSYIILHRIITQNLYLRKIMDFTDLPVPNSKSQSFTHIPGKIQSPL